MTFVQIKPPPTQWLFPSERDLARLPSDYVASGADLEPGTLLAAYAAGLFPMPGPGDRIDWWSPQVRGVMPIGGMRISRRLATSRRRFEIRVDTAFAEVMVRCATSRTVGNWIDGPITDAYRRLFEMGWAHSVEAWREDRLVGGVYGVSIGGLFAGESMFHRESDASKAALAALVDLLDDGVTGRLFDVQWQTPHLASLGVVEMSRGDYLTWLKDALALPLPAALDRSLE